VQIDPRASLSAATAAWAQRNGPIRLVVRIRDQKSSVSASRSANGIGAGVAGVRALLTRKSSRPSASIAFAHHALRLARLADIAGCGDGPVALHLEALDLVGSARVIGAGRLSATAAPLRANISAVASPMPEAAPVTSTALPERSALII